MSYFGPRPVVVSNVQVVRTKSSNMGNTSSYFFVYNSTISQILAFVFSSGPAPSSSYHEPSSKWEVHLLPKGDCCMWGIYGISPWKEWDCLRRIRGYLGNWDRHIILIEAAVFQRASSGQFGHSGYSLSSHQLAAIRSFLKRDNAWNRARYGWQNNSRTYFISKNNSSLRNFGRHLLNTECAICSIALVVTRSAGLSRSMMF